MAELLGQAGRHPLQADRPCCVAPPALGMLTFGDWSVNPQQAQHVLLSQRLQAAQHGLACPRALIQLVPDGCIQRLDIADDVHHRHAVLLACAVHLPLLCHHVALAASRSAWAAEHGPSPLLPSHQTRQQTVQGPSSARGGEVLMSAVRKAARSRARVAEKVP